MTRSQAKWASLGAAALPLLTLLVLTTLGFWGAPDDIPERSLVALGAWSSYAVTLVATVRGAIALWDLRDGRRQHRESLAAAVRPLLIASPETVEVRPTGLRLEVRNIGVGPALSLNCKVWLATVPEIREGSLVEANAVFDTAVTGLRGTQPHFELQATGHAVGGTTANWVRTTRMLPRLVPGSRVAIVYELEYKNVFDDRFRTESAMAERVRA